VASNKLSSFGPVAIIAGTGTNYISPAASGASAIGYTATASYIVLKHMRIVNKSGAAVPVSLFIGATSGSAAGTEFAFSASPVPATGSVDWYGSQRLDATQFLSGFAGTVTTLVLSAEGEIGLA
jgi:hypothetical protein